MNKFFLICTLLILSSLLPISANKDKFVLVIDAGHGGKDTGAIRGKRYEKDINLGVALALGKMIEANLKDVKVIYTRKTDVFVDLKKRAAIANKAKANLFVSVHTNSTAAKVTNAQGADTYILGLARSEENLAVAKRENSVILLEENYNQKYEGFNPKLPESYIIFEFMTDKYMEQSLQLASLIQQGFKNVARRKDRGVRQAGFLVLRETAMPSVLIEIGFINNLSEVKYLSSSVGKRGIASAIYSGIRKYIEDFERRQGKTASKKMKNEKPFFVSKDNNITKQEKKTQQVQTPSKQRESTNKQGIEYRVQFLISSRKLPKGSPKFKGLSPVQEYIDGGTYKYTYGSTPNESQAIKIKNQIRSKFKDAFVIKFKDGMRVK